MKILVFTIFWLLSFSILFSITLSAIIKNLTFFKNGKKYKRKLIAFFKHKGFLVLIFGNIILIAIFIMFLNIGKF